MNCLAFRRQLLIDPQQQDADFRAHAEVCTTCAQALQRALEIEASLYRALIQEYPERAGIDHTSESDQAADPEAMQQSSRREDPR
ncbi:MAG: DUF3379 family protein [Gammaproteobacteria bacterium]|nr:DUF3379 family protein [Gammaproteobacteria bacterium]